MSFFYPSPRADFLHEDGIEGPGGSVVGTEDWGGGATLSLEAEEVGPCGVDVFL